MDLCFERTERAALVEDKADIGASGIIGQAGDHGFGIGHLRDAGGVDEARNLQPPCAVADHAANEVELHFGRNDVGFVLQPVARANLDQFDVSA